MADDRELAKPPTIGDRIIDRLFRTATAASALVAIVTLVAVVGLIGRAAAPAVAEFGPDLLTSANYDRAAGQFGLLASIWGTLYTSFLALILATLFGVTAAIFLTEDFLPAGLRAVIRETIQLLAAIPSVIYGLWGIYVLIPALRPLAHWLHENAGWFPLFSTEYTNSGAILPAVIVLAVMVLPTITSLSIDAFRAVPPQLRAGAYALGATRWEAIRKVLLPTALTGIAGAVVLGFGRAVGETMALAMLVGNRDVIGWSVLAPGNTLAALIANKFPEADAAEESALMYAGLTLLLITLVVNSIGEVIIWRSSRRLRGLRR